MRVLKEWLVRAALLVGLVVPGLGQQVVHRLGPTDVITPGFWQAGTNLQLTVTALNASGIQINWANVAVPSTVLYSSGTYANPTWLTSLDFSKLTNVPANVGLPAMSGHAGQYLTNNGTTASWANLVIPTALSSFTNDTGFITSAAIPTNLSAFTNGPGYITGINSSMVTSALGFTPYNATNPAGYITSSGAPVQSVAGRTGTVTLTTSDVAEGTNLYFTNGRAAAALLTGYSSAPGIVAATDSIVGAFGKLNGNIAANTTAIAGKQATITTGTTAQYLRGDLSLGTFPTDNAGFTNGAGYITASALSPYLTTTAASSTYQPIIAAGTTSQYRRGDNTWQTLNQAAVAGLTTSDSPVFTGLTLGGVGGATVTVANTNQVTFSGQLSSSSHILAAGNITATGGTISLGSSANITTSTTNGNITLTPNGTGVLTATSTGNATAAFWSNNNYNGFRVQTSSANAQPYIAFDTGVGSVNGTSANQKAYILYAGDSNAYASLGYGGSTNAISYKTAGATAGNVGIGTIYPASKLSLVLGGVIGFETSAVGTNDSGISRLAANSLAFGNGTQGDVSGTLNAAALTGGASGLAINAGGTNQNITLTPSGTGTVSTAAPITSTGTNGITGTRFIATDTGNGFATNIGPILVGDALRLRSSNQLLFSSGANPQVGIDSGLARNTIGTIEANSGTAGNFGAFKSATFQLAELGTPTISSVTGSGATGAVTYSYKVIAKAADGTTSGAPSAASSNLSNRPATLNGTDYNTITWGAVAGATSYDIYRNTGGSGNSGQGLAATNVTGTTYNDTGAFANGSYNTQGLPYVGSHSSIRAGASDSIRFLNSGGSWMGDLSGGYFAAANQVYVGSAGNARMGSTEIMFGTNAFGLRFGGTTNPQTGYDAGVARTGTGIIEANNGQARGTFGQLQAGTVALQSLASPTTAITIANTGSAGSTSYTYKYTFEQADGTSTDAQGSATTATGNATLNGTNYNALTLPALPTGATRIGVYRTSGGATQGKIGTTTTTTFNDTGLTASGSAPGVNTSGGATVSSLGIISAFSGAGSGVRFSNGNRYTYINTTNQNASDTNYSIAFGGIATGASPYFGINYPLAFGYPTVEDTFWRRISLGILGITGTATGSSYGQLQAGTIALQSLTTPAISTVTNTGAAGSTTYTYKVVAKQADGTSTDASAAVSTATGNATIDGTNYNVVTWGAVTGATSYDVYRTVGGAAQGRIALSTTAVTLNDTGLTATVLTAPSVNATGGFVSSAAYNAAGTSGYPVVKWSSTQSTSRFGMLQIGSNGESEIYLSGPNPLTLNALSGLSSAGFVNFSTYGTTWTTGAGGFVFALGNNLLEQKNGTNAQTFNLYNTYTSGTVYERGFFKWSSNALQIGMEQVGGTNRDVSITTGGQSITLTASTADVTMPGAGDVIFSGKGRIKKPSDGVLGLTNSAGTDFGRLQLGGTTSAFPAIKRNGTAINFVLADNSGDAPITANDLTLTTGTITTATTNGNITLNANGTGSVSLAGGYLTVQQSTGNTTISSAQVSAPQVFHGNVNRFTLPAASVAGWTNITNASGTADSGISRLAANSLAFGNGTQGDVSGTLNAAALTGGASGLAINAGGTNQNITLTPSGTGTLNLNTGSTGYLQVNSGGATSGLQLISSYSGTVSLQTRSGGFGGWHSAQTFSLSTLAFSTSANNSLLGAITMPSAGVTKFTGDVAGNNFGQLQAGTIALQSLTSPSVAATAVTAGTAGSTSYTYRYAFEQADGTSTDAPSASQVVIATGNATLSGTNFITLTLPALPTGATRIGIYRTASGGTPATTGKIGTATGATFSDTGLTASGSAPTLNATGSVANLKTTAAMTIGGAINYNAADGANYIQLNDNVGYQLAMWPTGELRYSGSALRLGGDAYIYRDAANTLAQRNGTNAQTFRLYGSYTDASNYERLSVFVAGNDDYIEAQNAGTGQARHLNIGTAGSANLYLRTGGAPKWLVNAAGHFLANVDNTYDIGASGANRPRNVNVAGNIESGGPLDILPQATPAAPSTGVRLYTSNADNLVHAKDTAGTDSALMTQRFELEQRIRRLSLTDQLMASAVVNSGGTSRNGEMWAQATSSTTANGAARLVYNDGTQNNTGVTMSRQYGQYHLGQFINFGKPMGYRIVMQVGGWNAVSTGQIRSLWGAYPTLNTAVAGKAFGFRLARDTDPADGVLTTGSATITSATARFSQNDVGRTIINANITNGNASILTVNSATSVTLNQTATSTVSGQTLVISDNIRPILFAHDGTTLTESATLDRLPAGIAGGTPPGSLVNVMNEFVVLSDGAGNISLSINGTLVSTITGGPVGYSAQNKAGVGFDVSNGGETAAVTANVSELVIQRP